MSEEDLRQIGDLITWSANASATAIADLARAFKQIKALVDQSFGPPRYVVFMRPEHYSAMLPMRRRKLQPYIRKAVRRCSS